VGWYEFFSREAKIALQCRVPGRRSLLGRDPGQRWRRSQNDPVLLNSIRDGLGQIVLDDLIHCF
jgi:hypothetical protein